MHAHPEQDLNIVLATRNPHEVANYAQKQNNTTLYILDIGFQNAVNQGITLAEQIRDITIDSTIIFISTHENLKTLSLELSVQPWDFIAKDTGFKNIKNQLIKDLNEVYNQTKIKKFYYVLGKRSHSVPFDTISYLEVPATSKSVITMHTDTANIQFIGNLIDIERANEQLCRVQENILINLDKVVAIDSVMAKITLTNDTLMVDKHYLKKVLHKFENN